MGASNAIKVSDIQTLWSGYGEIARYQLDGDANKTVVVKHVMLPEDASHPRGWNTDRSHQRKVRSYQVECAWYEHYSQVCDELCSVAKCFGTLSTNNEFVMILEDLDAHGFPIRKQQASIQDMKECLNWLAHFHARFLFDKTNHLAHSFKELWSEGCYWHLDTRPDELEVLTDIELKQAAYKLDKVLKDCRYQTLLHGDAKLANFCFSENDDHVAAVDFQYVGKGCGMKDVAYFIGSCLDSEGCEQYVNDLLNDYFQYLEEALIQQSSTPSFADIESEWRSLFSIAWADFQRFLKGWSPDHWKIHNYSEYITQKALSLINPQTRR